VRQKLFLIDNMPAKLNQSHLSIYEAIAQKDSKLARRRMREHLEFVERTLLLIKKGEFKKARDEVFWNSLQPANTSWTFRRETLRQSHIEDGGVK